MAADQECYTTYPVCTATGVTDNYAVQENKPAYGRVVIIRN